MRVIGAALPLLVIAVSAAACGEAKRTAGVSDEISRTKALAARFERLWVKVRLSEQASKSELRELGQLTKLIQDPSDSEADSTRGIDPAGLRVEISEWIKKTVVRTAERAAGCSQTWNSELPASDRAQLRRIWERNVKALLSLHSLSREVIGRGLERLGSYYYATHAYGIWRRFAVGPRGRLAMPAERAEDVLGRIELAQFAMPQDHDRQWARAELELAVESIEPQRLKDLREVMHPALEDVIPIYCRSAEAILERMRMEGARHVSDHELWNELNVARGLALLGDALAWGKAPGLARRAN